MVPREAVRLINLQTPTQDNPPKQEQPHKHGYRDEEETAPQFVCHFIEIFFLDCFFDDWWFFGHAGIVTV